MLEVILKKYIILFIIKFKTLYFKDSSIEAVSGLLSENDNDYIITDIDNSSNSYLKSNVKDRVIFIGDAAHTIHPLAGLGLNMGIQDVFFLDLAFEKYLSSSNTLDSSFFNYYKSLSEQQNKKIMDTINFLKKFYEINFIPATVKKSLVRIFNDNFFLKSKIIQEATGVSTLKNLSTRDYYQSHY